MPYYGLAFEVSVYEKLAHWFGLWQPVTIISGKTGHLSRRRVGRVREQGPQCPRGHPPPPPIGPYTFHRLSTKLGAGPLTWDFRGHVSKHEAQVKTRHGRTCKDTSVSKRSQSGKLASCTAATFTIPENTKLRQQETNRSATISRA